MSAFEDAVKLIRLDNALLEGGTTNADMLVGLGVDEDEWVENTTPLVSAALSQETLDMPEFVVCAQAMVIGFVLGAEYGRLTADRELLS